MSKLVFWLVIVFAILFALRLLNAAKAKKRSAASPDREAAGKIEETVRCSRCGVFLPKAEARFGPTGLTCGDPNCRKST